MSRYIRLTAATAGLALAALAFSCGPGGGNNLAIPTRIAGTVKVPAASSELVGKPSPLARLGDWLMPEALALTGMTDPGGGILVSMYQIDESGNQAGGFLAQTLTASDGTYSLTVPSWDLYNPNLPRVVAVGDAASGTLMRRLVDDLARLAENRDIDPATEAAVRIIIEDAAARPLSQITPTEMAELTDNVVAAADAITGLTIESVNQRALQAARESEAVQRKVVAVTKTTTNTRPLARAGIDFRMTTGDPLALLGNAVDDDGDAFTSSDFQWRVAATPPASTIPTQPPVGRDFLFQPDVDGAYLLELVVTDPLGAPSPPDYVTIIGTTPPDKLTENTRVDAEGRITRALDWLVYTTAVRDVATNVFFPDVMLQDISGIPFLPLPEQMLVPGASALELRVTTEVHPAMSQDGTMIAFVSDMDPTAPGVGGSDFDVVVTPLASRAFPMWLTSNTIHDTQPDVQCPTPTFCVVAWVQEVGGLTNLVVNTLTDSGLGFIPGTESVINDGLNGHFSPLLSHDGNWLVYAAREPVVEGGDLEVYRLDLMTPGALPERVTDNLVDDDQIAIDGAAQVVLSHQSGGLFLTHPGLFDTVRVSDAQIIATHPSVSSDGTTIVYLGQTLEGTDVFTSDATGANATRITAEGSTSQPRVAPDASRILFRSSRDGDHEFYLR